MSYVCPRCERELSEPYCSDCNIELVGEASKPPPPRDTTLVLPPEASGAPSWQDRLGDLSLENDDEAPELPPIHGSEEPTPEEPTPEESDAPSWQNRLGDLPLEDNDGAPEATPVRESVELTPEEPTPLELTPEEPTSEESGAPSWQDRLGDLSLEDDDGLPEVILVRENEEPTPEEPATGLASAAGAGAAATRLTAPLWQNRLPARETEAIPSAAETLATGAPSVTGSARAEPWRERRPTAELPPPPPPAREPAPSAARAGPTSPALRFERTPPVAETESRDAEASAAAESDRRRAVLRPVKSYVDRGYEIYLVVGIAGSGKTQLLAAFETQLTRLRAGGFLNPLERTTGKVRVLRTPPGTFNCYPVSLGKRRAVFIDTSGEEYKWMYPRLSSTGRMREEDAALLRLVAPRLRGVVLLLNLKRLWKPESEEHENQIQIVAWVLELLRWIRSGDSVPKDFVGSFEAYVDSQVRAGKTKRLPFPVQMLFSKADQLLGFPLPAGTDAFGRRRWDERPLYPAGESPFWLAYHALPELFGALQNHACHFRFDFAHALTLDEVGVVDEKTPCGILHSLEWLLDSDWRWPWMTLPTRFWIDLQRRLDRPFGRARRRWRRLPDAEEL